MLLLLPSSVNLYILAYSDRVDFAHGQIFRSLQMGKLTVQNKQATLYVLVMYPRSIRKAQYQDDKYGQDIDTRAYV